MKIDLEKAIVHMVETMLPKRTKNKVFYTAVRINYDNFDKDISTCNILHLFFDCSSNYVKVGYLIAGFTDNIKLHEDNVIVKYASNHDSCWRDFMSSINKDLKNVVSEGGINVYEDHCTVSFSSFHKTKLYDAKLETVGDDYKFFNFKLVK